MSSTWDKNFKALKKFAKENGHCNVPYKGDTRYLAKWVNRRKLKYKDDPTKIPPSEINELNRIGFDWSTRKDKDDKHWNEIYQRLLEFKRKHGHCMVPLTYARDIELGNWVSNQRKRAKQNKLRQDRRELLNKIKFTWIVLNPTKKQNQTKSYVKHDEKWNQMFGKLKKFESEHGHCKVPYNYHHDHALGMWVSTQRRVFQKKTFMYGDRKEMHQIRKDLLDSIDFDFSPQTGNDNFSSKDSPDHPRASVYESLKEEGHGHQSSDDGSDDICDSAEESEIIAV